MSDKISNLLAMENSNFNQKVKNQIQGGRYSMRELKQELARILGSKVKDIKIERKQAEDLFKDEDNCFYFDAGDKGCGMIWYLRTRNKKMFITGVQVERVPERYFSCLDLLEQIALRQPDYNTIKDELREYHSNGTLSDDEYFYILGIYDRVINAIKYV